MKMLKNIFITGTLICVFAFNSMNVLAHCDTMNGPVITAAKDALNKDDVKLILIWVQPKDEATIKVLFDKTVKLRKINPEVKELADMYFFENLVRIHRAGEGVPYTGIKEAVEVELPIAAADKALESGSLDDVMKMLNTSVEKGVKEKFETMMAKKNYDKGNVEAGREFVESYVIFMHYVEGIYNSTVNNPEHPGESHVAAESENHGAAIEATNGKHLGSSGTDHTTHLLIIIGTLLVIGVQIITSKKKI